MNMSQLFRWALGAVVFVWVSCGSPNQVVLVISVHKNTQTNFQKISKDFSDVCFRLNQEDFSCQVKVDKHLTQPYEIRLYHPSQKLKLYKYDSQSQLESELRKFFAIQN